MAQARSETHIREFRTEVPQNQIEDLPCPAVVPSGCAVATDRAPLYWRPSVWRRAAAIRRCQTRCPSSSG
jgi:hypothetical protein